MMMVKLKAFIPLHCNDYKELEVDHSKELTAEVAELGPSVNV
jgi:hypothetical protein